MKRGDRIRIALIFDAEVPALGCGRRVVDAHIGSKWVRLTSLAGQRAKLHRRAFNNIVQATERRAARNQRSEQ